MAVLENALDDRLEAASVSAAIDAVRKAVQEMATIGVMMPDDASARGTTPPYARHQVPMARSVVTQKHQATGTNGHSMPIPLGEKAILVAAVQYSGVDRDQLSVLTGYKRSSRDAYIQRLREKGLVSLSGQTVMPTDDWIHALGTDFAPLPTGSELQEFWSGKLPEGERKILHELIRVFPAGLPRNAIDDLTGYRRSSRDAYIHRLKARRLVITDGGEVRASEMLF